MYFEDALRILDALPESKATLEQALDTRLELRSVLRQLGEGREMLKNLREGDAIAGRLNDDFRRGQVCAFMTSALSNFDLLDEALETGTRAANIALRLGNLQLRLVSTTCLEEVRFHRGDFEHVIELATGALEPVPTNWSQESSPANWVQEFFGMAVPPAIFGRAWLIMSLAELGRFTEAAKYAAEMIQLAEATKHTHAIGWAYLSTSILHLAKGDYGQSRSLVERWMNRPGPLDVAVLLPWADAIAAWTLAEIGEFAHSSDRVREAEQLLERQAARGVVGHRAWSYHAVGRACLRLDQLQDAQRLAGRSLEFSERHPAIAAHALHLLGEVAADSRHFDAESGTGHYRQALALSEQYGMRPLAAHCHLGLAKLYQRTGQPEEAREMLVAAATVYRELNMNFWLKQTLN